jgi:glucose/arabinose dehydrogenase
MRSRLACIVLLCAAASAACDGGSSSSSSSSSSDAGQPVTGRERIGWTQAALSLSDASLFQFAAYVDGARRALESVTCAPGSGDSVECSAPMPTLTAGRHTIEIVAFITSGSDVLESARSSPLQLNVAATTATAAPAAIAGITPRREGGSGSSVRLTASDGTELDAEIVATDLSDPVDVTVDPGGRILVAERRGRVRFFDTTAAARVREQSDVLPEPREGPLEIRSFAVAPDFATSRHLYVLGTQAREDVTRLLVTRYREVDGRLGEAAVLLAQDVSAAGVEGVVRFGETGAMYVAIAQTESSRGRILRVPVDGAALREDASGFATALGATRGLAWDAGALTMWSVGRRGGDDEIAVIRASGQSPSTAQTAGEPGDIRRVALPGGTIPSGVAVVRRSRGSLERDVIVSSVGMADLLRFRSAAGPPEADTAPARLLQGQFGAIGGVAAGPDGSLYFFTVNAAMWGTAADLLVRVAPAR